MPGTGCAATAMMSPMQDAPRARPIGAIEPTDGVAVDPASFRDPAGFVFRRDGVLLRQVTAAGAADWDASRRSGLLERLVADRLLVDHDEASSDLAATPDA